MKKTLLILFAGSSLALYSCSDTKSTSDDAVTTETVGTELIPGQNSEATAVESADPSMDATTDPATQPIIHPELTTATAPATGGNANSGPLNPAHGEPGHKCEIAVGAPLNSAPSTAPATIKPELPGPGQAPTTQRIEMPATTGSAPSPGSIMTAPAPSSGTPTVTAPGMNPPHGEPGHDCAVAVGAPLKK